MKIIITETYEEASLEAFKLVKDLVTTNPKCVLGLATGSTPLGLYKNMIEDHQKNGTSYKDVKTFNLDEYVGLPKHHRESYNTFMHTHLFYSLDIKEENISIPVGDSNDLAFECKSYEKALNQYTIDLQILGIGSNGHIGFNEPGTPFDSTTHIVTLQESTRNDNARFFHDLQEDVPTQAITMGIASVMKAKKIVLIACGDSKKDAIYKMIHGPITTDCPASILQTHKDVVVIVDKEAAKRIYIQK